MVGSPIANWFWVSDQTKCDSKDSYVYMIKGTVLTARDRARGATPGARAEEGAEGKALGGWDSPCGTARHTWGRDMGPPAGGAVAV